MSDSWGSCFWSIIHSYPFSICNVDQMNAFEVFLSLIEDVIPCPLCKGVIPNFIKVFSNHGHNYESEIKPIVLFNYTIDLHNYVNIKIKKPVVSHEDALDIWIDPNSGNLRVEFPIIFWSFLCVTSSFGTFHSENSQTLYRIYIHIVDTTFTFENHSKYLSLFTSIFSEDSIFHTENRIIRSGIDYLERFYKTDFNINHDQDAFKVGSTDFTISNSNIAISTIREVKDALLDNAPNKENDESQTKLESRSTPTHTPHEDVILFDDFPSTIWHHIFNDDTLCDFNGVPNDQQKIMFSIFSKFVKTESNIVVVWCHWWCGWGYSLQYICSNLTHAKGITPSRVQYEHCLSLGHEVTQGYIEDLEIPDNYDTIVLQHYLEFITDKRAVLKKIKSLCSTIIIIDFYLKSEQLNSNNRIKTLKSLENDLSYLNIEICHQFHDLLTLNDLQELQNRIKECSECVSIEYFSNLYKMLEILSHSDNIGIFCFICSCG